MALVNADRDVVFVNTLRMATSSGHVMGLFCPLMRWFSVVNDVAWY
jgi:hypothetical protein